MTLSTNTLGTSGIEITRVGLGAWALSGTDHNQWGPQDDSDSIATIHRAIELGVNWIDTAEAYGFGHSEDVIGRALASLPEADRPLLFTKVAMDRRDPATGDVIPSDEPIDIRAALERSLRHLRVDSVDLYQIHWQPSEPPTPLEEYWQTMVDLRDEGKVRAIGLSNHDVALLERAEAIGHVDSLQPHFSAIVRTNAPEIAWCAANGTGVIVYSPMHHGVLTGAFTRERVAQLPETDWRRKDPDFANGLEAKLEFVDLIAPIAERHGVTLGALAIGWVNAWHGVTAAIAGGRRPEQVEGWIDGANVRLSTEDLDEIAGALERTGAGEGPLRPPAD
jgi:aryl-alcohol dehydrogenase-like predicted oxidoreductase